MDFHEATTAKMIGGGGRFLEKIPQRRVYFREELKEIRDSLAPVLEGVGGTAILFAGIAIVKNGSSPEIFVPKYAGEMPQKLLHFLGKRRTYQETGEILIGEV